MFVFWVIGIASSGMMSEVSLVWGSMFKGLIDIIFERYLNIEGYSYL